jgi:1,4-alpha-glucan branching enzyme
MFTKKKKESNGSSSKSVKFDCFAPGARSVVVSGSFNKWSKRKNKMKGTKKGNWSCAVKLKPGTYQYRFVINGNEWIDDPNATKRCPDGLGGQNCVVHVN